MESGSRPRRKPMPFLTAVPLLLAALSPGAMLPDERASAPERQGLVPLRCEFVERLPVVTVAWAVDGKTRESRFLLDSGAEGSMFFPSADAPAARRTAEGEAKPRAVRLWSGSGAGRRDLGSTEFVTIPEGYVTADMAALVERLRIVGLIGADFFAAHDVLLDYREGMIFASPPRWKERPVPGFERLPLTPWGAWRTASVVLNETPFSMALMIVDTGTSMTVLPTSAAPGGPPPGAEASSTVTPFATYYGWREPRRVTIAPLKRPFDLPVSFVGEVTPVLRPGDLGERVLLRFGQDEAWIRRDPTPSQGATGTTSVAGPPGRS